MSQSARRMLVAQPPRFAVLFGQQCRGLAVVGEDGACGVELQHPAQTKRDLAEVDQGTGRVRHIGRCVGRLSATDAVDKVRHVDGSWLTYLTRLAHRRALLLLLAEEH